MEALAKKLANLMSENLSYDKDKEAVIAYGLTAFFQMFVICLSIVFEGIITGTLFENLILFFGVGIIRKNTGGAHSKTIFSCTTLSISTIIVLSFLAKYFVIYANPISVVLPLQIFLILISLVFIKEKVPLDTPNKPITNPNKIKRLRRNSYILWFLFSVASITLTIISYFESSLLSLSAAIIFSLTWQIFTLTNVGAKFFNQVDQFFNYNVK